MTLDCPFRNPLQPRVISVHSYYLTSYGYLRFYWIRFAACSIQQLEFAHTTGSFVIITTSYSSNVRSSLVGGIPFLLFGSCRLALPVFPHAGQLQWVSWGDAIVDRESSWKYIL